MQRSRIRLHIILFCALCLLGAQLAAYAHWLGHASAAAQAVAGSKHSDDGDDAKLHICATCAAFAGLASAPPTFVPPIAPAAAAAVLVPGNTGSYIPGRSPLAYPARAPPAVL